MLDKHRKRWTVTEGRQVVEMAELGFTNQQIGDKIGRTQSAVAVFLCNERKRLYSSQRLDGQASSPVIPVRKGRGPYKKRKVSILTRLIGLFKWKK